MALNSVLIVVLKISLLSYPNVKPNATLGERAFLFATPKLWNAVPRVIWESTSVDTFKRKLKTHLFKKSILYHLDYKIVFLAY